MLRDGKRSWEARTSLVWIIGEIGDKAAISALESAWTLADAPETFRVQVAIALGALGVLKPLRSYLVTGGDDPIDKVFVAKAAMGLSNLGDEPSIPVLMALKDDPEIGPYIVLALGRLGEPTVREALKGYLKEAMFRE